MRRDEGELRVCVCAKYVDEKVFGESVVGMFEE